MHVFYFVRLQIQLKLILIYFYYLIKLKRILNFLFILCTFCKIHLKPYIFLPFCKILFSIYFCYIYYIWLYPSTIFILFIYLFFIKIFIDQLLMASHDLIDHHEPVKTSYHVPERSLIRAVVSQQKLQEPFWPGLILWTFFFESFLMSTYPIYTSPYRRKDLLLLLSSPLPEHYLFFLVFKQMILCRMTSPGPPEDLSSSLSLSPSWTHFTASQPKQDDISYVQRLTLIQLRARCLS